MQGQRKNGERERERYGGVERLALEKSAREQRPERERERET